MAASDLGTRIRRARERQSWNQAQLAAAVGVGVRSVGRWERGEAVPRSAIGRLEAALGVDLTGPQPGPDPNEEAIRDLGKDRGGPMPPGDVDHLLRAYRQRRDRPA